MGLAGRVSGAVRGGAGLTVQLVRADGWSVTAQVGADERYELADVPLDSYRVVVVEAERSQEITLTRERPAATANFDLTGVKIEVETSVVRGVVRGGAGQTVRLQPARRLVARASRRSRRQLSLHRAACRRLRGRPR